MVFLSTTAHEVKEEAGRRRRQFIHSAFFFFNCFTISCWPLPYIMNQPQVYMCSLPPESPLTSHSIQPSRLSQSTGLSSRVTRSTPTCYLLHRWKRMLPCHSLNLSHPLPPPLCPQICSLCLCPAFCYPHTIGHYQTFTVFFSLQVSCSQVPG